MRILQVAALVSPGGEYGGPTRVAIEQAQALVRLGHDVVLAAGTWGFSEPPDRIGAVRTALFPARSITGARSVRGLACPALVAWVARHALHADIVHVHLGRDFVTMAAALAVRASAVPYVLQTHGMVQPSNKTPVRLFDNLLTLRVLRDAARVYHLTDEEEAGLRQLAPDANIAFMRNGIMVQPGLRRTPRAQPQEVLFLARLQERKRPLDFVAAALALASEFPGVRFTMVGPDEGQGRVVREAIAASGLAERLRWEGPLDPSMTTARISRADVYVLPSVNEVYPMSVLEALSVGVPTLLTTSCGLADLISSTGSGTVVEPGAEPLTQGLRTLLRDNDARRAAAEMAYATALSQLDIVEVAKRLAHDYRTATPTSSE